MFFLHPTKFVYRGGGFSGLTGVEAREDLGDVLIDSANDRTHILDHSFVIKIPAFSTRSFILKYSFLQPDHETFEDWDNARDRMILGVRYIAPYPTSYPYQETYAPLYRTTQEEFDRTLVNLFQAIEDEWLDFCCPRAICDCSDRKRRFGPR